MPQGQGSTEGLELSATESLVSGPGEHTGSENNRKFGFGNLFLQAMFFLVPKLAAFSKVFLVGSVVLGKPKAGHPAFLAEAKNNQGLSRMPRSRQVNSFVGRASLNSTPLNVAMARYAAKCWSCHSWHSCQNKHHCKRCRSKGKQLQATAVETTVVTAFLQYKDMVSDHHSNYVRSSLKKFSVPAVPTTSTRQKTLMLPHIAS